MTKERDFWNRKLDELKDSRSLKSEVQLSGIVGLSQAMLGHVRAGRRPLPLSAKAKRLDSLGYVFTRNIMLRLMPEEVAKDIMQFDNNRLLPESTEDDPNAGKEPPVISDDDWSPTKSS